MMFRNFKYDVSFSFAEENNAFVQEVADHLKATDLKYYYYKEEVVSVWGKDLKEHLSGIYGRQSRLCVIFISADYKEKVWTKFEIENAQLRAKKNIHEYVLPFKMDTTELPEIPSTVKYLSLDSFDSRRLADAICEKVMEHQQKDTFIIWLYGGVRHFFSSWKNSLITVVLALIVLFLALEDRLTPVDILAAKIYERSREKVKGSICRDGLFSRSRGQGTCSYHHGVLMKKDSLLPARTLEECRDEAEEISWLAK